MTRALAIVAGVLLVVAVALGFAWRHERAAVAEAQRVAQAEQLKAKGLLVAAQASADELAAAAARIPGLEDELAMAKAAVPGTRVIYLDRLVTVPVVAGGSPRPAPTQPPSGGPPPPGGGPLCLLAPGDRGELRATVVGLETTLGNRVVVGTAEAWRLEPGPPTRLLAGAFSAPLSSAAAEPSTHPAPEERVWWLGGWAEWDPTNLQGTPEYALELDRQLLQLGPVDVGAFATLARVYDSKDAQGRQTFTTQARIGARAGWSF